MMNSTESQLVSSDRMTPTDDVAPAAAAALLEQHLGVNYQQYYTAFNHPTNDIALLQTPAGWGSVPGPYAYNGVGLSSSPASLIPFGFCLPGYLPASDATRPLACESCEVGHRVCDSQTDFGYHDDVMGGRLTTSHNDTAAAITQHQQLQLQDPSWVTHRPPRLGTFDWRSYEDDNYECSADHAECIPLAVSSSPPPSSSSSLSPSNDATMAAASTSASQCADPVLALTRSSCTKPNEDDREEGSCSPDASCSGFPPQQGHRLSSARGVAPSPEQQGPLPVQIRLQEASVESSFDDGGDESSPSPVFDRRRGSLGSRPRAAQTDAVGSGGDAAGSRLGVTAEGGVPAQARRSSIACMPATTRALGAALDYESLKVKLEKLTGPVTEGTTRRDSAAGSLRAALLDRRRTSIAVMPTHGHPTTGPTTADEGQRMMMGRESRDSVSSTDNESNAVGHCKMLDTTGTMNTMMSDGSQQLHHTTICTNHSQESTNSLEPYDKNLSDDLSSSSSSSSSSTTSSSCLLKFRLHCILEQILQNDARLQEIVRRHESERQDVRMKHRFQWMELEKSLTRTFGDEWRRFAATIPELSLDSTPPPPAPDGGSSSNDLNLHGNFTDDRQNDYVTNGTVLSNNYNQSVTVEQPLETITEGLIFEDSFLEVSPDSSSNQRRPSLMPCDCCAKPAAAGSNVDRVSRRFSEGNMDCSKRVKRRSFRCVNSKQHETPQIVQNNGESIDTRPCSNNIPNRQCPVGILFPSSSRLHGYATDATTSKTLNNTDNSQVYGLLHPVQDPRSCLQATLTARLSQMYTQNALQALLTAQLLDVNSTVYGFDPGLDLTGYGPHSLLPTGRPACAVQELGQQVVTFPWTAPHQIQNIHSLPGLYHYQEFM